MHLLLRLPKNSWLKREARFAQLATIDNYFMLYFKQ
jgi:hypothetical protein